MMEEWKEYKLGDIAIVTMGQSPNSSFYNNEGIGIPFLQGNRTFGVKYPSFDTFTISGTKYAEENDVIMSVRAPVGDVNITPVRICLGRGVCGLRANNDNQEYLYYLMRYYANELINKESGTVFGSVNRNDIEKLLVKVPSFEIQERTAKFLKSLDDKIEVNKRINDNLEAQAQALFKSWFVDFEPFKDGKFVESELGMIPKGWRVGTLDQVTCNITDGVHNTVKDVPNGGFYLLSCKNIKGGIITLGNHERTIDENTFYRLRKRTKLQRGDILLSSVGTIGEMVLLNDNLCNIEFQRSVAMIKPDSDVITPHFLFYSLKNQKEKIIHSAHGAVQQCLFISDIANFITIIPPIEEINKFTDLVKVLVDRKTSNEKENLRLSTLRDTLLPKLMSGELKVNDIKTAYE